MNNVFVYCEIEGTQVQEVSQELLTKGRKLANTLGVELHAVVAGTDIKGKVEDQILPYGVDKLFVFDAKDLFPYTSAPHTDILVNLFKEEQPQICLMGATVIGRDLGPRVSSSLTSGLTADCTELEIGPYEDKKEGKPYENLLYQIRPAFGGNIVATIVNPDHRPQMATVRSGVMQKALYEERPELNLNQWSVADVDGDVMQCGLNGSPTKVKAIKNIVFQAKESKTLTASDADIEGMIKELLEEKIIG